MAENDGVSIEFDCEDCGIFTVNIMATEMPPEGQRLCMICRFVRQQPEWDRAELRKRLHGEPKPEWQISS